LFFTFAPSKMSWAQKFLQTETVQPCQEDTRLPANSDCIERGGWLHGHFETL
jgi:hypothetical protein